MILVRGFLLFLEIRYSLHLKGTYSSILFNFVIIISGFIIFIDSNDWIKVFVYAFCIIVMVVSLYWLSGNYDSRQSYFESPRKSNTLIINQNYVLNKNYTEFYKQKYLIFKKKIPRDAISGYTQLGLKDIEIEWINEGEVCVYHSIFNGIATLNINLSEQ